MKGLKTPMKAVVTRAMLVAASALALAACGRDVTQPTISSPTPGNPQRALVGVIDGIYTFVVSPGQADTLRLGKSYAVLPSGSICSLANSGYGPSYWNSPCTPEKNPVTITAIVRNAATDNPSIEFQPALRFNPSTNVDLYIYVTNAATLSNMTVMQYCSGDLFSSCVDESLTDPSLKTTVNPWAGMVYRRIKHFSGYLVSE